MISKIALVLWVNAVLKRRDVVLVRVFPNITEEHKMEMRNAPIFVPWNFFPWMSSFELWRSPAASLWIKQLRKLYLVVTGRKPLELPGRHGLSV